MTVYTLLYCAVMQSEFLSAVPYGNHGCSGGRAGNTYDYIINNGGVDLASYYPFKGRVSLGDQDIDILSGMRKTTNREKKPGISDRTW